MNLMPSSLSDGYCQVVVRSFDHLRTALGKALPGRGQFVPPLALRFAATGAPHKIQRWNTEVIFLLIQSIPSPNAEPFSGSALGGWLLGRFDIFRCAQIVPALRTQLGWPQVSAELSGKTGPTQIKSYDTIVRFEEKSS